MSTTNKTLSLLFLMASSPSCYGAGAGPFGEVPVAYAAPWGYRGAATTTDCVKSLKNATGTAISTSTLRVEPEFTGGQFQIQVRGVDQNGSNAQYFTPRSMEVTDNTYEFSVGAPHFKR